MRSELKHMQMDFGITSLYVTHDQLEALSMADRVAVMHEGVLQQFDTPRKIYEKPANAWVATFVGEPQMSLLEWKISSERKKINLVALDNVTDPRNIGSIIRSAASFNIDGIIVKERSFPGESKLLYKCASGCSEHIKIFEVSNIKTTLKHLKTKNFWVCGFDKNGEKNFTDHDWNGNNVLLFGSEGYGLKYQTIKGSDFLLKLDIFLQIDLNDLKVYSFFSSSNILFLF